MRLFRKIQAGEFAMQTFGRFIVGAGSCSLGVKTAQIYGFPVYSNATSPFSSFPRNAFETTCTASLQAPITYALRDRAFSEILFSIVQSVVIYMVAVFFWTTIENDSVHFNAISLPRIKATGIFIPLSLPIVFTQALKIFDINNRILRSGQWNISKILAIWLNYIMALFKNYPACAREFIETSMRTKSSGRVWCRNEYATAM